MNIPLLIANLLTLIAFFIHTIAGDKEVRDIQPDGTDAVKQERWTQVRCGWHWVSMDLLLATIGLALVNFTDHFPDERTIVLLFSFYFLVYAIAWGITIAISRPFPMRFAKLGQWMLLLSISALLYWGTL
ncbi:MAG: hypothetical protein AAFV95_10305 [Bacteroidota bacterium]